MLEKTETFYNPQPLAGWKTLSMNGTYITKMSSIVVSQSQIIVPNLRTIRLVLSQILPDRSKL